MIWPFTAIRRLRDLTAQQSSMISDLTALVRRQGATIDGLTAELGDAHAENAALRGQVVALNAALAARTETEDRLRSLVAHAVATGDVVVLRRGRAA